jgi:glycosyltransferase involved in cell wall biosynthesis/peptidoglycan/xylan/chitin deacetylase (PgdA/CDA1 family)
VTELSVVVPTFNRAEVVRGCLDALRRQTAPPTTFEVIVVDDGSTDATPSVLESYDALFRLRVVRQENRGAAAARNRGIELATGPVVHFLDDDIVADEELVAEHLRAQGARPLVGLGSLRLQRAGRDGGLVRHFAAWWDDHYRRLATGELEADFWACYSGNLSAPTAALRDAGGFDETFRRSDDVELGYRLTRAGLPIAYLPRASAEQRYLKGFRGVVGDFDAAGEAAPALLRKHPEVGAYRPFGDFTQGNARTILLRRLLLAVHAPTWPLGLVDPLLARRPPARLYRFLQLYCFWRGMRRADRDTWLRLTRAPVILMYHAVGEPASRFIVSPRRLQRQLDWIRRRGYRVVHLDELVQAREEGRLPAARTLVLTFDDAYAEVGSLVAPLLRERGQTATVFVPTGAVGDANRWDDAPPLQGRPMLGWDELRAHREQGIVIGAHTVTHPSLPALEPAEVERELVESREQLAGELGLPPRHFAYPHGKRSPAVLEAAARHFASACGIDPGSNGPAVPLNDLRRLEVRGTRRLLRFAIELWLGRPLTDTS